MRLCRFVQYEVDSDKSVCFLGVKAGHLSESNNCSATCSRFLPWDYEELANTLLVKERRVPLCEHHRYDYLKSKDTLEYACCLHRDVTECASCVSPYYKPLIIVPSSAKAAEETETQTPVDATIKPKPESKQTMAESTETTGKSVPTKPSAKEAVEDFTASIAASVADQCYRRITDRMTELSVEMERLKQVYTELDNLRGTVPRFLHDHVRYSKQPEVG